MMMMMMVNWCRCRVVWEVRFHPSHPSHLFTCSNDGSLWHWDSSDITSFSSATGLLASATTPAKGLRISNYVYGCTGFQLHQICNLAIFGNPTKSSSSQISSWICWTPVQLQCVQLITDKTNASDLSSGVFTLITAVTLTEKKYQSHSRFTHFVKTAGKQWCQKGITGLYYLFVAADSIVDAISFIRHIVLLSENKFCSSPDLPLAGFEFLN